MAKLSAPSGFRDFPPDAFRKRQELIQRVREVYESFGFEGIETPVMEDLSVFAGKAGENEKLMFTIMRRGEALTKQLEVYKNAPPEKQAEAQKQLADAGMRFDLTVPLARFYATHRANLPAIFKRYHIGPVWRADRAQRGRFREFFQCDVDVIGSASMMVEAEVILATSTALARLGFTGLTVKLNARPLLQLLGASYGVAADQINRFFIEIDKLEKITPEEAQANLAAIGMPPDQSAKMLAFYAASRNADSYALLGQAEAQVGAAAAEHVKQLREICELTPALPSGKLMFDPFLARGMDYYTGPIFEIAAEGVPFALGGGGRYDNLLAAFSGQKVPACGFSIGFERVLTLMEERNMFGANTRAADVLIAVPSPESQRAALELGLELRAAGLRVDVYPGAAKLPKQFELAEKKGLGWAALPQPDGQVTLRELATRQDTSLNRAEAAAWLKAKLGL